MKNLLSNLKWIPEFYFILVSLLWFYVTVNNQPNHYEGMINFPAVVLIVIFHIQLFLNDSSFGKVLTGIIVLATIYLIVSYASRIMTMDIYNYDSQMFALKLGNLILLNFIMAYLMYKKYKKVQVSAELSE